MRNIVYPLIFLLISPSLLATIPSFSLKELLPSEIVSSRSDSNPKNGSYSRFCNEGIKNDRVEYILDGNYSLIDTTKKRWASNLIKTPNGNLYYSNLANGDSQYEIVVIIYSEFEELYKLLDENRVYRFFANVNLKKGEDSSFYYSNSSLRIRTNDKLLTDKNLLKRIKKILSKVRCDVFIRDGYKERLPYSYRLAIGKLSN